MNPVVQSVSSSEQSDGASARSIGLAFAFFAVAMVATLGVLLFWSQSRHGSSGVWVALAAWGLSTGGALISLVIAAVFSNTAHATSANLFGMLPRMAVPLVGLIGLGAIWPEWIALSGPGLLMACYFVALITETLLTVRLLVPANPKSSDRSAAPKVLGA